MKKFILFGLSLGLAACVNSSYDSVDNTMVFFDFDSARITENADAKLKDVAAYMKLNPDQNIIIEGHCDERGSTEYNLALGALRAGNAKHVIVKERIEPERISTISYGKERPQFPGTGEEVWRLNRNATIVVE
jgi:peptidoglycan-associated lipoprotein